MAVPSVAAQGDQPGEPAPPCPPGTPNCEPENPPPPLGGGGGDGGDGGGGGKKHQDRNNDRKGGGGGGGGDGFTLISQESSTEDIDIDGEIEVVEDFDVTFFLFDPFWFLFADELCSPLNPDWVNELVPGCIFAD